MKKLPVPVSYKSLVSKVSKELSELEFFVKRRTAEGYWRVGRYIDEHLLANKQRADYGKHLLERLAKDVDRDQTTFTRALQFYRTYPILAERHELNWNHYKSLITIKDKEERKKLEQKVIQKEWGTKKLQEYLSTKRELTDSKNDDKPVPQLTFTRGRLNTYQIVGANKTLVERSPLVIDLGFRQQYLISKTAARFKENDFVEIVFEKSKLSSVSKIDTWLPLKDMWKPVLSSINFLEKACISKENIFTYQARVDKVIDGDTFLVSFDFHLAVSISQKLRLRGINCPEIDTEEGKKAKRFVESRLKDCEFLIVKTYKDRSDKFDRYLADVFFLEGATDPAKVAEEGIYLNQELLNNHLAVAWK